VNSRPLLWAFVAVASVLALWCMPASAWEPGEIARESGASGNVLPDGSVEADAWVPGEGAVLSAEAARTGGRGARVQRPDDKTRPTVDSPRFPASPGAWLVSGWLRTTMAANRDPNYSAVLDVEWLDAQGTSLGQ